MFRLLSLLLVASAVADDERLSFQTSGPWSPRTNLNADVAMVYGIGPRMPANIASWKEHRYQIHVMTGVAWGQYQDYLNGSFDGVDHWDQAQTEANGKRILHGGNANVPYISPGENYGKYLTLGVKRALDAGAESIHLEEPEFWARGGWEENFKREWKAYYQQDWQAPNSSPDAQYRASKLKYYLYRRALSQVFDFVRQYGKENHRNIRCYVPTHSLLNYAHWKIVSPESSLLEVGADGYIAQVWTGTARTPNVYEGRRQERTFETAFLEYGAMQNLVRASGRRVWYLNDPIEDNPNHDWEDYRTNWESTLVASLLQPEVWHYEIMPWPDRVFNSRHPLKSSDITNKVTIPKPYETELQTVITALGDMKQSDVRWLRAGTAQTGVLVADTMMFQRAEPEPSDANLGSFYGLALPLLKRGIPVEAVQIESANSSGFLDRYKLLFLTYEGQKPPDPKFHDALSQWVRKGGALVVVDDDKDPYHGVKEWWNTAPYQFKTPRQHLFQTLGMPLDATGLHPIGKGVVLREAASPAALTYEANGAERIRHLTQQAATAGKVPWAESNALVLRRGPYLIAAGLSESVPNAKPFVLSGRYVNLFDPELSLLRRVEVSAGSRALLFDLAYRPSKIPKVVAAGCRVRNENFKDQVLRFQADGIGDTQGILAISSAAPPTEVTIDGQPVRFDFQDGLTRLRFANSPAGLPVVLRFTSKSR
ncbi:hypothetical protein [Bryobacter aggregatus]|uniref:hypothetical protein n=1 Tax=Bryobacter aggregatus TaxID=360054 RepID=UPI0004E262EC|nr:hypothetical protein [Bryobacter aggregatus]